MVEPHRLISWVAFIALVWWLPGCFPGALTCDESPGLPRCALDTSSGEVDTTAPPADADDALDSSTPTDAAGDTPSSEADQATADDIQGDADDTGTPPCPTDCSFLDTACSEGVCEHGDCVRRFVDAPCNDGLGCTLNDRCVDGSCVGDARDCDDGVACSADGCFEPSGTCGHEYGACECTVDTECDDHDACSGTERCVQNACVEGTPVTCPASSPSGNVCVVPTCNPATGGCDDVPVQGPRGCDDADPCSVEDGCDLGACKGTPRACTDALACSVDACSSEAGGCVFDTTGCECVVDDDCQDGNLCNGRERCDVGTCVLGTTVVCPESEETCQKAVCAPSTGECTMVDQPGPCDDANPCTEYDQCVGGSCTGTTRTCDYTDTCQLEGTCDPATGGCLTHPNGSTCLSQGGQDGACELGTCQTYLELTLGRHMCAAKRNSLGTSWRFKCWGPGLNGALGIGTQDDVGDSPETPVIASPELDPELDFVQISAGSLRTCARTRTGEVVCWGRGAFGALATGATTDRLEPSDDWVNVGGRLAKEIETYDDHTCIVTTAGGLMCWGAGGLGRLGYGSTANVGDTTANLPAAVGLVDVGAEVQDVDLGFQSTCVLLASGAVKCWGRNNNGQLGYGDEQARGDQPTTKPSLLPTVQLTSSAGVVVTALDSGATHYCAHLSDGQAKCWGANAAGQLGITWSGDVGDDELPSVTPFIDLGVEGAEIVSIQAGGGFTCVLYAVGSLRQVKCFGENRGGQLGLGVDGAMPTTPPAELPPLNLGGNVHAIVVNDTAACAVMSTGAVRCWGNNNGGKLGVGSTDAVGEAPEQMPPQDTLIFEGDP